MIKKILLVISCLSLISCSSLKKNTVDGYQNLSANEIYDRGLVNLHKKRYAKSIGDFEALEARFPFSSQATKGMIALAYSYYANDDKGSALATIDRFIKTNPMHPNIDYIFYLRGMVYYKDNYGTVYRYFPLNRAYRDQKIAREGFNQFKILVEQFPHSKYIADAKQRMIVLRDQLAEHELSVAQYYLAKRAYVAAVNRAETVLMDYNQSKFVPEALKVLKTGYNKLHLPELEKNVDRIIALNHF